MLIKIPWKEHRARCLNSTNMTPELNRSQEHPPSTARVFLILGLVLSSLPTALILTGAQSDRKKRGHQQGTKK
ncbi:hypothetical protein NIA70_20220, partial [[Clostridium] scindens]|uniref:hypothetical protein n=1 Tax=Clostridium scindens (strain JCM 10418 / VPI 12708) TaxID=29347 RepID=UPI0020979E22